MSEQPGENTPPKIIVDSDWKAQAQKERDRLAAKEREEAAKRAPARSAGAPSGGAAGSPGAGSQVGTDPAAGEGAGGGIPQADFPAVVGTMATQALMYLGAFPDPQSGRAIVSLEYAKFHIDMLSVLEQKTRGNLSQQEADDLKQALTELRLRFVEIARAVEKASKEGRLRPGGAGPASAVSAGAGGAGISGPGL